MDQPCDNLYVTNLPNGLDESMVSQFFSIYGTVTSCKVLKNPLQTDKTAALVRFASVEEARTILETLNGATPTGLEEPVQIKYAAKKVEKGAGKADLPGGAGVPAAAAGAGAPMAKGFGKWDRFSAGSGADGGSTDRYSPWSAGAGKGKDGKDGGAWTEPEVSDNIYVQGLPPGTTEDSLMTTFMEFGNIKSIKLMSSKGPDVPCAALIRFADREAAKLTKDILNGQTPEGFPAPLVVKFANQKGSSQVAQPHAQPYAQHDPPWMGDKGKCKGKGKQQDELNCETLVNMIYDSEALPGGKQYRNDRACVYVGGLPGDTSETHLYKMFSPYGAIHSCSSKQPGAAGIGWAIGFINYLDPMSADAAVTAYNGMNLPDGSKLKVSVKSGKAW